MQWPRIWLALKNIWPFLALNPMMTSQIALPTAATGLCHFLFWQLQLSLFTSSKLGFPNRCRGDRDFYLHCPFFGRVVFRLTDNKYLTTSVGTIVDGVRGFGGRS